MSVDLTLPATSSPAIDPYKDLPDPLLPFALFVHVALGDDEEEMANMEKTCNSQSEGATPVRRAPHHDLAGRPLRAALAEHLDRLVATRRFDPFYFVAVVDADWREAGVVLVTLDGGSDETVCRIGQLRVPATEAGRILVNLQLANVDWDDFKEQCGDGGDGRDADADENGGEDGDTAV